MDYIKLPSIKHPDVNKSSCFVWDESNINISLKSILTFTLSWWHSHLSAVIFQGHHVKIDLSLSFLWREVLRVWHHPHYIYVLFSSFVVFVKWSRKWAKSLYIQIVNPFFHPLWSRLGGLWLILLRDAEVKSGVSLHGEVFVTSDVILTTNNTSRESGCLVD